MLYHFSRRLLRVFLTIFGRLKSEGLQNVPKSGPVILAPNHISYLDPPAVGAALMRVVHYMAKEELFESKFLNAWMRAIGTFPVKRGSADRKAIKQALDYLAQGEVICVFPEGKRSEDGKLGEPEMGLGMFAIKSRAPVVPVAVIGTDKVLPAHAKFFHFHPVKIIYGKPLTFPDLYESKDSRQAMEEVGRLTMAAIAEMLAKGK